MREAVDGRLDVVYRKESKCRKNDGGACEKGWDGNGYMVQIDRDYTTDVREPQVPFYIFSSNSIPIELWLTSHKRQLFSTTQTGRHLCFLC